MPAASRPLKVLVADDDLTIRLVARAMLSAGGHEVVLARDGAEALHAFLRDAPDVVLLDFEMPGMNGVEACRAIKHHAGTRFVPVVFVTGADEEQIARCIDAGGDAFLPKPYSARTLLSQVGAMARQIALHATVQRQAEELRLHQERLLLEQEMAAQIFHRILSQGELDAPNVRYHLRPASTFGGDLVLAAPTPSGNQHVLVGDFTGHGLPAALGALPVSEVFYARTAGGYDLLAIVNEINERLRRMLPPGMFLAAAIAEFDPRHGRVAVWNGGLPDALVTREGAGVVHRFVSRHLPLGILPAEDLDLTLESVLVEPGDRVVLFSDGVTEASDAAGRLFGDERVAACFAPDAPLHGGLSRLRDAVYAHRAGAPRLDDEALIEVTCLTPLAASVMLEAAEAVETLDATSPGGPRGREGGRIVLELEASVLRDVDPMPLLAQMVSEMPGVSTRRESVCLVLAELVANSVQHGLLALPSAMKATPEGFDAFYRELARLRSRLTTGWVRVELEHVGAGDAHSLTVRVSDSGPGFDVRAERAAIEDNDGYAGRGLSLVRSLCESVTFQDGGSIVEAVMTWSAPSAETGAAPGAAREAA